MKKFILAMAFTVLIVSACNKSEESSLSNDNESVLVTKETTVSFSQTTPLGRIDLDKNIKAIIQTNNDFHWEWVDAYTLWSALNYGNHSLAIGYKPAFENNVDDKIHQLNLSSGKWKAVHDAILQLVLDELKKSGQQNVLLSDILVEDDPVLPIITLRVTSKEVLLKLYNLENIRYLEPLDYYPASAAIESSSGCGGSTTTLNTADYTTITPNCRLPWNFNNLNIPAAWNVSQGAGVKIGVIDAGISSSQSLLGADFTNGASAGTRTITSGYTYGTSTYTSCTHGTSMCGLAAGPRNGLNSSTGVAYLSSLHFIHGCEDVVLDKSAEKTGVKNALKQMGDMADLKIISMSIGSPFSSGVLQDGCTYAYNMGKLIFAAAGTSFSWTSWWGVIYPAAYSQCIAVTGVNESSQTCSDCHDGSQVKFTVPMERNASTSRNSVSLPPSGTVPTYIGGSSAATSTAAGIAALVWSAKPTLTRTQVYDCMKNTAQYYPTPNASRGYGNINAGAAVNLALTY